MCTLKWTIGLIKIHYSIGIKTHDDYSQIKKSKYNRHYKKIPPNIQIRKNNIAKVEVNEGYGIQNKCIAEYNYW